MQWRAVRHRVVDGHAAGEPERRLRIVPVTRSLRNPSRSLLLRDLKCAERCEDRTLLNEGTHWRVPNLFLDGDDDLSLEGHAEPTVSTADVRRRMTSTALFFEASGGERTIKRV